MPGDEPSDAVDGPADAVRHLNEVRGVLATVRARADADPCRYTLSGDRDVLGAEGGTFRVDVETGADCAWTAKGGDGVASVSAASGAGSAGIEVTVDENRGWERPVEVVVAGQVHARRQAGSRPVTPVCERSTGGLLRLAHPDTHAGGISLVCRQLTFDADFLASLRYLTNHPEEEIDGSALQQGDLDGLTGLVRLKFKDVETLPAGVFDGLTNLTDLGLGKNHLGGLESGQFSNLPGLEILGLNGNRLTALEPGVFHGLLELETLFLGDNGLRGLTPGLFEGLGSVTHLVLWGNRLGQVPMGAFDGLDHLLELNLEQSGVTAFEPGVFDGLDLLRRMTLQANGFRELEPGGLRGLDLSDFDLRDNPGTPFTFAPAAVALREPDSMAGQPLAIAVENASAAPFNLDVTLGVSGGTLSRRKVRIAAGEARSEPFTVTPEGDGPVTVAVNAKPAVVTSYRDTCGRRAPIGLTRGYCYRGLRVAPGPPLLLNAIEDRSLTLGQGVETVDLSGVFSYFLGAADYTAESSDEAVAAVTVEDGTLTVDPGAAGSATVTVTATGADGETLTRTFDVTVRVPSVPLFLAGSESEREGFVRLINRSAKAGAVRITAIDDRGTRYGPVTLQVGAHRAVHFNTGDLENGNESKGLAEGIGPGAGDWRLEFESSLDIEPLAYVRTADGFLTAMHDTAPVAAGSHRVAIFNPADNARQRSRLRVVNPGRERAEVTVVGTDDAGASPGGVVRFTVPAGAVRTYTAWQLETGGGGLDGALGDGEGKWRLAVDSAARIETMSLLENVSTGHLTNLSSVPDPPAGDGVHHVPLFPAASDSRGRQGFARVINRSERTGTVDIVAFGDAGERYGPLELAVGAGEAAHFNSEDLEFGNAAKGLSGSTGPGEGDWRLELMSGLEIEVLAYVRTDDGFLTAMHDAVAIEDGRRLAPVFNPGSNPNQASSLRLVNSSPKAVEVAIYGTDDAGGTSEVSARFEVPARASLIVTAVELEAGVPSELFEGYWDRWPLGDGSGKWRLSAVTEEPVRVMSLMESPTGHLTNLSSAPHAN